MKKNRLFLFIVAFLFLFAACTGNDFSEEEDLQLPENPYEVSLESAVEKGIDFMIQMYPATRSASSFGMIDAKTIYRTTHPLTKSETAVDIPLHVIHFLTEKAEPNGFVVLLGDKRVKNPILVFSDQNSWDLSGAPVFEEIFFESVDLLMAQSIEQYDPAEDIWKTRADPNQDCLDGYVSYQDEYLYEIPHRTEWTQSTPYNRYMPVCSTGGYNMPAGCATIAVAQIFAHFKYPVSGGGYTWEYDPMTTVPDAKLLSVPRQEQIARLVEYIGGQLGVNYGCSNSGVSAPTIPGKLNNMGYNSGNYVRFNVSDAYHSLRQGQLVYMRGENSAGKGHGWVIEGVRKTLYHEEYWDVCAPDFNPIWVGESHWETNYHYYNIGYGGGENENGWYFIIYNSQPANMYGGLTYDLKMIPYIRPK